MRVYHVYIYACDIILHASLRLPIIHLHNACAHQVKGERWSGDLPVLTPGQILANEVGSMHQSFSIDEPFAGLLIWGGVHAVITSEAYAGKHLPGFELLKLREDQGLLS